MENVKGVERFINDFIEWYGPFLREVREFGLDVPGTEAFGSRASIDRPHPIFMAGVGECGYDVRDRSWLGLGPKIVAKGTLDSLVAKEQELAGRLDALAAEHGVQMPTVYFKYLNAVGRDTPGGFVCLPQYDVFANAMEFAVGGDHGCRVAFHLVFDDSSGPLDPCFALRRGVALYVNPSPKVPGVKNVRKCNESWRCFDHPDGESAGYLEYNIDGDYDGNFFYAGNPVFGFKVAQHFLADTAQFCLFEDVRIGEHVLGTGAMTAFLEMLEEGSPDEEDYD